MIAARPLLTFASSIAIENGIALAEALPAAHSLNSGSVLVFAAPHLALPFEIMQSRIPQFQYELLS